MGRIKRKSQKKTNILGWLRRGPERKRMIEFKMNLPYKLRPDERQGPTNPNGVEVAEGFFKHDRNMTDWLIRAAINAKYPEGKSKEKAIKKLNARVHDALVDTHLAKSDTAEFSREQLEHVRDCLAEWDRCQTDRQAHLVRLEEHVEETLALDLARAAHEREAKKAAASANGSEKTLEPAKA